MTLLKVVLSLYIFFQVYDITVHASVNRKKKIKNVYPAGFTALMNEKLEQALQNPIHSTFYSSKIAYSSGRRVQEVNKTQQIRIKFITTPLEKTLSESNDFNTKLRGDAVISKILPHLASTFALALKVKPLQSIPIPKDSCFGFFEEYITDDMYLNGIIDSDVAIFISAFENLGDTTLCRKDPNMSTLAVSTPCNIEVSSNRPVIGLANICLNSLALTSNDTIDPGSLLVMEDVLTHEFIHIFGLNSVLYKYYRSAYDNSPLTPRRNTIFGFRNEFETKRFSCVNDKPDQILEVVNENTLVFRTESVELYGGRRQNRGYYKIVLPTVTQVTRNQFNCQKLNGARLENQPTSEMECFGSHFDERFFFTDIMSAVYDDDASYFSPLTLALLEDTGWYISDFKRAENSPFGIGMGCDFVEKDCIDNGLVPTYSSGFFCNDSVNQKTQCGPSHYFRGQCDLRFTFDPKRNYFPGEFIGPQFINADYCPLVQLDSVDCDSVNASKIDPVEIFDDDSRCMNVNLQDGSQTAVCIKARCDVDTKQFIFNVGNITSTCGVSDEGKLIVLNHNNSEYTFFCTRLAQVCPE